MPSEMPKVKNTGLTSWTTGEHLLVGDKRRLVVTKSAKVDELIQSAQPTDLHRQAAPRGFRRGSMSFSLRREKVWPMPSGGDVRAEPKVGVREPW